MFCAISGDVPKEPVVNRNTGHLYEKRLILQYIETNGTDPITGNQLSPDDLINVQVTPTVRPRPVSATSVPQILSQLQNEWDELMLETFTLKQHLATTRQQLSQALYQHDAACRVIARLIRERDEARAMISEQNAMFARSNQDDKVDSDMKEMEAEGISPEVLEKMTNKWKELSTSRKKRAIPSNLAQPEEFKSWEQKASYILHKSDKPGILCFDFHPTDENVVVTGGVDKEALVFHRQTEQVLARLSGHSKKVLSACFHPQSEGKVILTTSADKTVKCWRAEDDAYYEAFTSDVHTAEVVGITIHPLGEYFVTASKDKTWSFFNLDLGVCLQQVVDPAVTGGFECVSFHPDGLILGTGTTDALIRIWDMKTQSNVATFEGHTDAVLDIAFSENGYHMASASSDGKVRLWDLRKLKDFHTIDVSNSPVHAISFDSSGQYLACGSDKISIYVVKQWDQLTQFEYNSTVVTDLKFGPSASYLVASSMDRSLKVFGQFFG